MQLFGLHSVCVCVSECACVCYIGFVPLQCCQNVADKGERQSRHTLHCTIQSLPYCDSVLGQSPKSNATHIYARVKDSQFQPVRHKKTHTQTSH